MLPGSRFPAARRSNTLTPDETAEVLPVIASRCEEIGRDPASLPVSVHVGWDDYATAGVQRVDMLAAYRELGLSRAMGLLRASAQTDAALESLVADATAAGIEFA